jgi:hypothetical protein
VIGAGLLAVGGGWWGLVNLSRTELLTTRKGQRGSVWTHTFKTKNSCLFLARRRGWAWTQSVRERFRVRVGEVAEGTESEKPAKTSLVFFKA